MSASSSPRTPRYDAEVVVVGCGPVGATLALLLGRAGVRTLVVDRHRDVYPAPRAVAADDEVLRLLTASGLGAAVAAMAPARGARFVSPSGARLLDVELPGSGGAPGLALYRQPDLEHAVRAAVQRLPEVTMRLGVAAATVSQDVDAVRVRLADGDTVTARYLVACDGARSPVREQLGIGCRGPGDGQSWLVVDARGTPPAWVARDRVTYVCDPGRAAVAMPTPTGWRLEALLTEGHPTGPVPVEVARRLSGGRLDVPADDVERAVVYRFTTRTAARWRAGRVLLAGDAAHTMPPFAGQGLAAGLRDVHALAWRLALVVTGTADAALLDGYEQDRRPHLRRMTALTRLVGALVTAPAAVTPVRDTGLRVVASTPWVGGRLRSGAVRRGTSLSSRRWPHLPGATARGGGLVPAAQLSRDGTTAPLEVLLGGRFTLLSGGPGTGRPSPGDHLTEAAARAWERLGGQSLHLAGPVAPLSDPDGHPAVVPHGQVLVVRPDLVVAAAARPEQLSTVVLALADRLGCTRPSEPRLLVSA